MNDKRCKNVVLSFDLDNTLINNREGIVASFNYALRKYNLPILEKSQIEYMIGTPLSEMFHNITDYNASKLVASFREYYGKKGIYQAILLPGIKSKLKELYRLSYTLGIITSKKQEMAIKIIEILNIKKYFDYVIGETEETQELGKLDPKLKIILEKNYPGFYIIIIGDHPKDALLSKNLECPFIGVLTGSHSEDALRKARANNKLTLILPSVTQIRIDMIHMLLEENYKK